MTFNEVRRKLADEPDIIGYVAEDSDGTIYCAAWMLHDGYYQRIPLEGPVRQIPPEKIPAGLRWEHWNQRLMRMTR